MLIRLREEIERRKEKLCKRYTGIKVKCVIDRYGTVLYISDERQEILGFEPDAFLNRRPVDLCLPDEAETVKDAFARMRESETASVEYNFHAQHKNGHWIPMQGEGEPLFENGICVGYVIVYHERIDKAELAKQEDLESRIRKILNKQKRTG